jgi:hypothetical protein
MSVVFPMPLFPMMVMTFPRAFWGSKLPTLIKRYKGVGGYKGYGFSFLRNDHKVFIQ